MSFRFIQRENLLNAVDSNSFGGLLMNKFEVVSSIQSYSHYNTSPLYVSYSLNFVVFNDSNSILNFYSYNPPLNIISLINNAKEEIMSFKPHNSNFIKRTLLIAIILSFPSFAFSEETETNENKKISIAIMPFYGLEDIDRYFAANLLSTKLTNFTVINTDSKILNDSSIYSNMTAEQYTNFMFLNSKYIKTDYILLSGIIIEDGYQKCSLSVINTKNNEIETILDNKIISYYQQPVSIASVLEYITNEFLFYIAFYNLMHF